MLLSRDIQDLDSTQDQVSLIIMNHEIVSFRSCTDIYGSIDSWRAVTDNHVHVRLRSRLKVTD